MISINLTVNTQTLTLVFIVPVEEQDAVTVFNVDDYEIDNDFLNPVPIVHPTVPEKEIPVGNPKTILHEPSVNLVASVIVNW